MPLRAEGMGRARAFLYGALSGAVEPVGALLTIRLSAWVVPALPGVLGFAAGAMIYVAVEAMAPETPGDTRSGRDTLMFALGFTAMMAMDAALG